MRDSQNFVLHIFDCSVSAVQCLLRVVVVVVGKKFEIKAKKPDTAMDHYIIIVANDKSRSFPLMTSDLWGQGHSGLPLQLLQSLEKLLLLFSTLLCNKCICETCDSQYFVSQFFFNSLIQRLDLRDAWQPKFCLAVFFQLSDTVTGFARRVTAKILSRIFFSTPLCSKCICETRDSQNFVSQIFFNSLM